jgi:hypothetical protein
LLAHANHQIQTLEDPQIHTKTQRKCDPKFTCRKKGERRSRACARQNARTNFASFEYTRVPCLFLVGFRILFEGRASIRLLWKISYRFPEQA